MRRPDFLALYRCKTPYNPDEILIDNIAWIQKEKLEVIAEQMCFQVAGHTHLRALAGDQVIKFDKLIRPLLVASDQQRKLLMHRGYNLDEE